MPDIYLVWCSCPDEKIAEKLARLVLEKHLAACVKIFPPIRALYHWREQLRDERVHYLMCKTTQSAYPALEKLLKLEHPDAIPEILSVPVVVGLPTYLDWIRSECKI